MNKAKSPKPADSNPPLVLFGIDEHSKPRAARFAGADSELAIKAGALMGLKRCTVNSAQLTEVAQKLPQGRIYANGKGFVPYVRRELYSRLVQAAEHAGQLEAASAEGASAAGGEQATATDPAVLPQTWDEIAVGHLVIAQETLPDGWFEAIVTERRDDMLTLRWRDYPRQSPVVRHFTAVALLRPPTA